MIRKLFSLQKRYIDYFFDHLDMEEVEEAISVLLACRGFILFTGVGKSGIIAQKIASTLVSTGLRALYVAATDALHGDLGIATNLDLLVVLSKSGESDELLALALAAQEKGVPLIGFISNRKSRLAKMCNTLVHLPLERELCPFDLSPTTSAAIQLIFGDVVAVALMRARDYPLEEYAQNHPAGRIGRRANTRVHEMMLKGDAVPLCRGSDKLGDLLVDLSNKKCGCLVVVDEQQELQGIFTDGDLRRSLQAKGHLALEERLDNLMTRTPRSISSDRPAREAMEEMEKDPSRPIMVLPVVKDKKVVGLIKLHDLVQGGL